MKHLYSKNYKTLMKKTEDYKKKKKKEKIYWVLGLKELIVKMAIEPKAI